MPIKRWMKCGGRSSSARVARSAASSEDKWWWLLSRLFHLDGNKWKMLNELFRHNRGMIAE